MPCQATLLVAAHVALAVGLVPLQASDAFRKFGMGWGIEPLNT